MGRRRRRRGLECGKGLQKHPKARVLECTWTLRVPGGVVSAWGVLRSINIIVTISHSCLKPELHVSSVLWQPGHLWAPSLPGPLRAAGP